MSHPNDLSPKELGVDTAPYRGPALATTMADLSRVLGGLGMNPTTAERANAAAAELFNFTPPAPSPARDAAIARIEASVKRLADEAIAPFRDLMLKERHRISIAIYGNRQMNMWPIPGKALTTILADTRDRLEKVDYWREAQRMNLRAAIAAVEQIMREDAG